MMEKIMEMVEDVVGKAISKETGVPEEKKTAAVEATAGSLLDGLKKYATPDNLSSLTSMLGLGKSGGSAAAGPGMTGGLESGVVKALTTKVGLSQNIAGKIANTVVPAVMSLFKKKVDDDNEPDFNLGSLVGGLTGKSGSAVSGEGIKDLIGSFLK